MIAKILVSDVGEIVAFILLYQSVDIRKNPFSEFHKAQSCI